MAALAYPNVGAFIPALHRLMPRVVAADDWIRIAATRHGVAVFDSWELTTDLRRWSPDRIHATPEGHRRIGARMAHALQSMGTHLFRGSEDD
jgi:lysophospholipase L1-like esterase